MSRPIHFEMHSPDPSATCAFFKDVFGWGYDEWKSGETEYHLATTGEKGTPGIDGGIIQSHDGQPRTVNTIQVDDVDAFSELITQNGGEVVVPKFPIPGVGWIAYCKEPTGILFGIYKHDEKAGSKM